MSANTLRATLYRVLSLFGAVSALVVVGLFAASQLSFPYSTWRDLFPFPGLYFLEISVLVVVAALASWNNTQPQPAWQADLPWGTAGVLLAFVILGAFTIGLYLIPAFLCFLGAGVVDPHLRREQIPARLGMLVGTGLMQALLVVFAVIAGT